MKHPEHKKLAEKLIKEGDKRSYNEIIADIQLQLHREKMTPEPKK